MNHVKSRILQNPRQSRSFRTRSCLHAVICKNSECNTTVRACTTGCAYGRTQDNQAPGIRSRYVWWVNDVVLEQRYVQSSLTHSPSLLLLRALITTPVPGLAEVLMGGALTNCGLSRLVHSLAIPMARWHGCGEALHPPQHGRLCQEEFFCLISRKSGVE